MTNLINQWGFLTGKWESDPETHIGNESNTVNKATISQRPSDQFLFMVNEAYRSGNSQGEGWNLFYYDDANDKIMCKSIYGMGFAVNYIEESRTEEEFTMTANSVDAIPDGFEESKWKLKLTKLKNDQFLLSLYMGDKDDNFTIFWDARYNRI